MILVKPSSQIMAVMEGHGVMFPLYLIEQAGRTCYKSEDKITPDSAEKFIKAIIKNGHESVIEHSAMTVRFIVDRGVTHELVRHRLAAYSQESTRYCNYKGGVTFVIPPWSELHPVELMEEHNVQEHTVSHADYLWAHSMLLAEDTYIKLLSLGWSPQQARSVLPNSLKTEIVVTANFREWRHIFKLRTSQAAHPQMREIMQPLLTQVKQNVPVIFDDIQ